MPLSQTYATAAPAAAAAAAAGKGVRRPCKSKRRNRAPSSKDVAGDSTFTP